MQRFIVAAFLSLTSAFPGLAFAQPAPITYRVTFPEPEHHWMQVEMTVSGLGSAPLRARMSRSSPGRYAVHEFAKNVFWFEATDGGGRKLAATRPDVDEWQVGGHDGSVRVTYRIFGDRADGTYFGVDTTHAHLNMPAAFMWAVGLENRSMRVTFAPPAGTRWKVATQLYPTEDSLTYTAPNLQYFMDSPTELSEFLVSSFTVPNADGSPARFRLVAHTDGSQSDLDELAKLVERLVREQRAVFGEFPAFEPGYYTFLLDYSAWGDGDGMEHRNSTMISEPGLSIKSSTDRLAALDAISHEFFHIWNVERIRPVGLEPFDFTRQNITCCLWLAEGFTQYYGDLLLVRAGLSQGSPAVYAPPVITNGARLVRSAVQMSEQAAFDDAATSIDRHDRSRTFISYYVFGAAIALGLDWSIRDKTAGAASLDDFMRLLWQRFGRSAESRAGYVGRPYAIKDLRDALGEITKDRAFADEFFDKYVEGRDVVDYARLFSLAGFALKPRNPDGGWVGQFQVQQAQGGVSVDSLVPFGTPAYDAGLDLGDVVTMIGGQPATMAAWNGLRQRKAGDIVAITIRRRDGKDVEKTLTIKADPALTIEDLAVSGTMTPEQKAFREAWLSSKVR